MAFIKRENLPARQIGNRVIPPLSKFYRADGSFELFDMTYAPFNIQYLCNKNYAGFRRIRCNKTINYDCSFGEYQNAGVDYTGTINTLGVNDAGSGGNHSGRAVTAVLKLKLDNPLGLTPVYFYVWTGAEGDDDNAGRTIIRSYDYSGNVIMNKNSTSRGSSQTWDNRTGMPVDYKDIYWMWAGTGSRGGGKFPGCRVKAEYRFITRIPQTFTDIYRVYS